jgi:hypothetical protein
MLAAKQSALSQCMQPFDILGQGLGFGWQVVDRNFTSKENGTVGVNPGDFVYVSISPHRVQKTDLLDADGSTPCPWAKPTTDKESGSGLRITTPS